MWPWPIDPKINRGPPWVIIDSCVKYHHCIWKGNGPRSYRAETVQSFKSEFDLDLWPIDPKINRGPPWVMINSCLKYHHCMSKGNGVIVRKPPFHRQTDSQPISIPPHSFAGGWGYPRTDRRTDRQTAMVKPVYPHNFIGRGYNNSF